jgi:hypothetical protein
MVDVKTLGQVEMFFLCPVQLSVNVLVCYACCWMLEKVVRYIRSRGVRVGGTEAVFITSPHGSLAVACLSEGVVHVCVGMTSNPSRVDEVRDRS